MNYNSYEDAVEKIEAAYRDRLKGIHHTYNPRDKEPHQVVIHLQWNKTNGGLLRWGKGETMALAAQAALVKILRADV